jgi:isocitrate/isopropylmalate dehydrogenase
VAKFRIVVTAGDGIGPEVIAEGVKVLKANGKKMDIPSISVMNCWAVRRLMPPAKL